jgi:PAS domain S-box-containing protein
MLDDLNFHTYLPELYGLTLLSWDKDQLSLKWTTTNSENLDRFKNNSELINLIKHIQNEDSNYINYLIGVNHDCLYFISPLIEFKNSVKGILIADLALKDFINFSVPKLLFKYYNIKIFNEDDRLLFKMGSKINTNPSRMASASVYTPFDPKWKVEVFPVEALLEDSHFPNVILVIGLIFTLLIPTLLYLLQQFLRSKAELVEALDDREEAAAYRQAILDSSNYSIIATDADGIILSFNKAAERMLLWKAEEVIGKMTPEVFLDKVELYKRAKELSLELNKEIPPDLHVFTESLKKHAVEEGEWTKVRKDGTKFPTWLSVTAVKNSKGEVIGYVRITQDLTKLKELEQMKNDLIGITSHELRTPLASIKGSLDLLSDVKNLSPQEKTIIHIAYKNTEQLLKLTNDILDTQKIDLGKMEFVFTTFPLKNLIIKAIDINQIFCLSNEINLKKFVNVPDCKIYGDEDRLLQVLTNFITNAVKNSPPNTDISFVVTKKDSSVRIGVQDHGHGIPEEFQPFVFHKFSQDLTNKNFKKGSGLGLSISKSIIEAHHGTIGFDTSPQGTTFWFELPIA